MSQINRNQALKILNLKEGFSEEELKSAYKKMAKAYHPDLGGNHEDFLLVKDGYEYLKLNPSPPIKQSINPSEVFDQSSAQPYNNTPSPGGDHRDSISPDFTSVIESYLTNFKYTLTALITYPPYLYKALLTQFFLNTFFGFHIIRSVNGQPSLTYYLNLLTLTILTILSLSTFLIILALYHQPKLAKLLSFKKFPPRRIKTLRNFSLILFPLTTLSGYFFYLTLRAIQKTLNILLRSL